MTATKRNAADNMNLSNKRTRRQTLSDNPENIPNNHQGDTEWSSESVHDVQERIMANLTPNAKTPLVGLDEVYTSIYSKLESTVFEKESNSALIYGQHGTGKSQLVTNALSQLKTKSTKQRKINFKVVELNGLIHTDDRLVLRAIVECLGTQDIQVDQQEQQLDIASGGSFAQNFLKLFEQLKTSGPNTSIIFILNNFELFLAHPRQILVYNLFDTVQSGSLPLSVIGVTCCIDAVDMLEKRVRSRFSGVSYYVPPVQSIELYSQVLKNAITLSTDEDLSVAASLIDKFNDAVETLFQDASFSAIVAKTFNVTGKLKPLINVLMEATLSLTVMSPYLTPLMVSDCAHRQQRDSKTDLLRGLSQLEFCLIISMNRMRNDTTDVCNFEMLYEEYSDFATSKLLGVKKGVALKALDRLKRLELVSSVDSVSKCPLEFRMMRLLVESDQVVESAMKSDVLEYRVKRWASEKD